MISRYTLVLPLLLQLILSTSSSAKQPQQQQQRQKQQHQKQLRQLPQISSQQRAVKSKSKDSKDPKDASKGKGFIKSYFENANSDAYVGAGNPGDRVVWYNTTWVDEDDNYEASSSGHCVVLQAQPSFLYYCHYSVAFPEGMLLFEGVSPDYGQAATYMTITGGTGRYKDVVGLVATLPPESVTAEQVFMNTVFLF
jgi:hypothetical protein